MKPTSTITAEIINDLIVKHMAGTTTSKEYKTLEDWVCASDENMTAFLKNPAVCAPGESTDTLKKFLDKIKSL